MSPRSSAEVIRRQRWEIIRERSLRLLQKFDPDQPRDEDGKWTSGGSGDGSAGSAASEAPQAAKPAPKLTVASGVSKFAEGRVRSAFAALPPQHQQQLKDVPIKMTEVTTDSIVMSMAGKNVAGLYSHEPGYEGIYLAEKAPMTWISSEEGQVGKEISADMPMLQLHRTALHEFGHAIDHKSGWKNGEAIWPRAQWYKQRMTEEEKQNATHWLKNPKEAYAELYAMRHNPEQDRYFGGLTKDRASEVFKEALQLLVHQERQSGIAKSVGGRGAEKTPA